MISAFIMLPILFSFLFQLSTEEQLSFKYLLQRSTCDHCHQPLQFFNFPYLVSVCRKGELHAAENDYLSIILSENAQL